MKKVLCAVLVLMALTGCEYAGPVYPKNIREAETVCAANGDLDYMQMTPEQVVVHCKNGAEFRNKK